jgi:hypothetical protein
MIRTKHRGELDQAASADDGIDPAGREGGEHEQKNGQEPDIRHSSGTTCS